MRMKKNPQIHWLQAIIWPSGISRNSGKNPWNLQRKIIDVSLWIISMKFYKFKNNWTFTEICDIQFVRNCVDVEVGAMEKCASLVDLKTLCTMRLHLQNSASTDTVEKVDSKVWATDQPPNPSPPSPICDPGWKKESMEKILCGRPDYLPVGRLTNRAALYRSSLHCPI